MPSEFQVQRHALERHRVVERDSVELGAGQVRLKVDTFSFTANNLTYGIVGDLLGYWKFFPAADNSNDLWGLLPVWAMADVVESRHEAVPVGDRLFGYFPPATELVMTPKDVSENTLFDGTPHRQVLPPLYNRYLRVQSDPTYRREHDAGRTLLGPLHITSYCLWDQLSENDFYGADQVIIVSASSKTSIGLAFALSNDANAPATVGLTSSRNEGFVSGCGLYDATISYENLGAALANKKSVVVDMAGNAQVRGALLQSLGTDLAYYIAVGATHWDALGTADGSDPAVADKTENFFAPSYMLARMKELGPSEWDKRSTTFLQQAANACFGWVTVEEKSGLEGLAEVYGSIAKGEFPPDRGVITKM